MVLGKYEGDAEENNDYMLYWDGGAGRAKDDREDEKASDVSYLWIMHLQMTRSAWGDWDILY